MAKGKKAGKELTPEERLEQALVPVEEQPYPVPENWCWTRLGKITEVIGGGTPSSKVEEYYKDGSVPWISPADLSGYNDIYISRGAKNITKLGLEKSSAQLLPSGTVCLSSRAPIGYVAIAKNKLCTNQGFKSFLPASCYIPEYLYWYLKGNKELLESYASGTTFLELSGSKASLVELPLAPLSEQHRIVDCIESLFGKLDEAKEKAQAVVDGFELRKSAILHKAFMGELTELWRKEHGVGLDSWKETVLKNAITLLSGQDFSPEKYNSIQDGLPYITGASNFEKNHVIINRWTQTPTVIAYANDVLLVCKGSGFGKVIIADFSEAHIARQIMSLRPREEIHNRFLYYFLQYQSEYIKDSGQGLIPGISRKVVLEMGIVLPILEEQKECVSILDNLFTKEQRAKESAEAVLSQIDTMKKAILARAFRGELGTNDPAEENAAELIMSILNTD